MAGIVRNGVWYSGVQTPATTSSLGLVQPDGNTITIQNGVISSQGGGGGSKEAWFCTSDTAAATAAKTATSTTGTFALQTGYRIYVKFDNANTAVSPTLNVDNRGAINIKAYGATAPTLSWVAGDVVEFVYDGTNFIMLPSMGIVEALNTRLAAVETAMTRTLIVETNNS